MSLKEQIKKYYKVFIVLILIAVEITMTYNLTRLRSKYFPAVVDRPIGAQLFADIMGEARTVLASYIYIRADMYHHEREEHYAWNEDPATLPLYRLITLLDPKLVNAYDFASYHLAVDLGRYKQGIKFLQEGLMYNPNNYQLNFTMGDILYSKKDYENAERYYSKALNIAMEPIDLKNALRRLYWVERKLHRPDEAEKYIKMFEHHDPSNPMLPRLKEQLELIKSGKKTEEQMERETEQRRAEGRKELEKMKKDYLNKIEHGDEHPEDTKEDELAPPDEKNLRPKHEHHDGCNHE